MSSIKPEQTFDERVAASKVKLDTYNQSLSDTFNAPSTKPVLVQSFDTRQFQFNADGSIKSPDDGEDEPVYDADGGKVPTAPAGYFYKKVNGEYILHEGAVSEELGTKW